MRGCFICLSRFSFLVFMLKGDRAFSAATFSVSLENKFNAAGDEKAQISSSCNQMITKALPIIFHAQQDKQTSV